VTQKKRRHESAPHKQKNFSRSLRSAVNPLYCTVQTHPIPIAAPPAPCRHRNLRCPNTVGAATVTKATNADPLRA